MTPRSGVTAPLRHRNFRALALGRTLTYGGNSVATVALGFAVLDVTGSVVDLGLVVGARSLANVALLLFGGVVADRLPRPLVLQGSCALAATTQATLAASVLLGFATLPLMVALSLANGAAAAANLPAAAALTPQTVPSELLQRANALLRIGVHLGMFGGMSAGGVIVGWVGPGWAIGINGAMFALSGVCFAFLRISTGGEPGQPRTRPLRDLVEGWREFSSRTWVWLVVAQFTVVNATWSATTAVLGPALADDTFGRTLWGVLMATNSVGLVAGGVLAARWQPRRALAYGVALISLMTLPMLALAGSPVPLVLFPAMFLAGAAAEQFSVAWEISLQQNIPQRRLARVYSYDALGSFLALPAGEIAVGPIAERLGIGTTLTGMAALLLVATAVTAASRSVRGLERAEPGA